MHNKAMEMAKWAMEDACAKGYDNMNSQDWDDFKDCVETAKNAIKCDYYYRLVEQMKREEEQGFHDRMYFPVPDMMRPMPIYDGVSGSESWRDSGSKEWDDMKDEYRGGRGAADGRLRKSGSSTQGAKGTRGRYGFSFDEYMEAREMYPGQEQEHKKRRMEALNRELDELIEMGREVVEEMPAEEKQIWKGKISKILNM